MIIPIIMPPIMTPPRFQKRGDGDDEDELSTGEAIIVGVLFLCILGVVLYIIWDTI